MIGANAQGKTNILEALYCLSTTRSFRSAPDEEMIKIGEEEGALEGVLHREDGQEKVRLEFRRSGNKTLSVNGKKQKKLSSLLGKIPAVVFSPDDLFLVKGAPALRRRYLDVTILQMDALYLANLQHYERALKQRNSLLRQKIPGLESQLGVWDIPLAQHGAALMVKRQKVAKQLSDFAGRALWDLTGGTERFEVRYEPRVAWEEDENFLREKILRSLQESRAQEIARGATLMGPHRDDLGLWLNEQSLRNFGSQGQQRTGALALKLAQLTLLAQGCHTEPLVLFDDVMAELDEKRREFFLNRLQQGGQAFLTGTSVDDFKAASQKARIFAVESGQLALIQKGPDDPDSI
jgi:DNA replication and repair protein RecF